MSENIPHTVAGLLTKCTYVEYATQCDGYLTKCTYVEYATQCDGYVIVIYSLYGY